MQSRRIARELALLGMSQLSDTESAAVDDAARAQAVSGVLSGAIVTLTTEIKEALETASGELTRADRHLLTSETRTDEPEAPRQQVQSSIDRIKTAIKRLAYAAELPQDRIPSIIAEVKQLLEAAAAELTQCDSRLAAPSEAVPAEAVPAKNAGGTSPTQAAIAQVQTAINRTGPAVDLYQFVTIAKQDEVMDYAQQILQNLTQHQNALDTTLDNAMENWKLKRLVRVDRDILRIALAEILYLQLDKRIAIDEAIEIAKRYSDDAGYRFINGVMRRVTDRLANEPKVSAP
ncbi:MAG: transcription antitermination factor NusB [Cyanobacteria bacterium J06627_15]